MKSAPALLLAILFLSGCVTDDSQSSSAPGGYPITGSSSIELTAEFKYMPSLSGYYLPPGIYVAEGEDANGVFFRSPAGSRSLSLGGSKEVPGGIYLPKEGGNRRRGFAYLTLAFVGRSEYYLPDTFFRDYGIKWGIIEEPNQTPQTSPIDPTL